MECATHMEGGHLSQDYISFKKEEPSERTLAQQHLMKQLHYNQLFLIIWQTTMSEISESEDYAPERDREQSEHQRELVYKRRVQKFNENSIEGKWTDEENLRYILYMDYHYKIFVSKEKRKSQRIFKSLSEFLVTRTPRQCRSHFQKIMNKFANLRKVRQFYQEELGVTHYQARLDQLAEELSHRDVKTEETEVPKCMAYTHTEVQTDPLGLKIADLSSGEVLKLMNMLYQCQKYQMPTMTVWPQEELTHKNNISDR